MFSNINELTEEQLFAAIEEQLTNLGFTVISKDHDRPWGGFFVLDEQQAPQFIETFFSHLTLKDFDTYGKLSPKILVVAPDKRLSWQYHHRRAEIWKLIGGVGAVMVSETDDQTEPNELKLGDVVELKCGERHRLIGTSGFGIVAEIWKHTDPQSPSDEEDIVRISDDFGR